MFGLLLVAWQIVAHANPAIAPVGAIWDALVHAPHRFVANALWTIDEMAVGLVASAAAAFVLAVVMAQVPVVERAVMPVAVVLNVTPVVSIAPGLTFVFGFSMVPRYLVTGIIVFFPFLVNAFIGLRSVDAEALAVFRTVAASHVQVLWRLRLPTSLPYLFAAARICVPLSLVGAVVAEFTTTGATRGLGWVIIVASQYSDFPTLYAAVFCLAVIGVVASGAVVVAERRLLSWQRPRRG